MKQIIKFTAAIMLSAIVLFSCQSSKPLTKSEKLDVNTAFKKVYELTQAALEANPGLKIENIDLTFETTITTEASGGVKLWVLTGKYTRSKSVAKKVTYTFAENKATGFKAADIHDKSDKAFVDHLIAAIKAANEIQSIQNFGLKEMEVEIAFTITNKGEIEAEIELVPVTPSASISRESEVAHTITLKLVKQ